MQNSVFSRIDTLLSLKGLDIALANALTEVMHNGVFTLPDTETDTDTDKKWLVCKNYVEVFTLHRDRYKQRFLLDSVHISSVLVSVSVSVTRCAHPSPCGPKASQFHAVFDISAKSYVGAF